MRPFGRLSIHCLKPASNFLSLLRTTQPALPFGARCRCFATVKDCAPAVVQEEGIRLREYQEECIQSVLSYLDRGHKRLGISLATGSGKTVIFTRLIDRVQPPTKDAKQTLILAHRRELVEQAAKHCERAYPGKSIEVEMGDIRASGAAEITVASIRSLQSWDRLSKYDPKSFKLVLVDEAHHIVAPGYLEVLEHFGLYPQESTKTSTAALVGVSATFSRFDGLRLGAAIDHIVYHKDYVDMIGEKWLSDVMFTTVKSRANLSRVRTGKDGDFQAGELSKAVNTDETNEITFQSWLSEAGERKSTLIFCVDLNHVASLTSKFRQHGIDARYITGSTRKKERGQRLGAFKKREFPVLLNCAVFTEGTDMPNIDCVLLARPTKSRNLLVQMIGRGMRLYSGKQNCHVIDMVASLETGIVTVPTLFGLDPSEIVKDASSEDLQKLKEERERDAYSATPSPSNTDLSNTTLDFTHYDSVQDLIGDTSGERHVRALSPNAWVQIDSHKYILTAKGGMLTLESRTPTASDPLTPDIAVDDLDDFDDLPILPSPAPTSNSSNPNTKEKQDEEPLYHVIWKYNLPPTAKAKSPYSKPRTVATATTLTAALNAADTFASKKFERIFITTSSSWRKTPVSAQQLEFLNKIRGVDATNDLNINTINGSDEAATKGAATSGFLTPDDLSKGQAADMITKIKFGARGRFDRMMGVRRKREREEGRVEKVRKMRDRERVGVGPLQA